VTLERIARFQEQVAHLRRVETNPENYHGKSYSSKAPGARQGLTTECRRRQTSSAPASLHLFAAPDTWR
jgi:hypothetical protein